MDFFRASRRFNVQSAASANPFWTFSVLPAASTSNPPLLQIPFGLSPCFPPLQRPICHSFSLLLDFLLPSRRFNVQSAASANPFWTSSRLSAASTSNPPLLQIPFGLPPCFPLLQRPILRSFSLLLDFLLPSRRFNVQSAALSHSFWTFSVLPAASTSNLPLFLTPFGLPPAFPLLHRPILRSFSLLLDFLLPSRRFNVQSATLSHSFWTSSCASRRFNVQSAALSHSFWTSSVLPAASTSNPPLFLTPFGLLPASPPLQRPIRRFCKSLLDFFLPSRRFHVQSAASTHVFVVYEYFINYYLTLISEYFIFLL